MFAWQFGPFVLIPWLHVTKDRCYFFGKDWITTTWWFGWLCFQFRWESMRHEPR